MLEKLGTIAAKNYDKPYYFLRSQTISNYDGHKIASVDIDTGVTSDSVLRMARAIISEAMNLDDRNVNIDNEVKIKTTGVSLGKKEENRLSLENLKKKVKGKSFEEKASFAELLSGSVKDKYEKIKSDISVKNCISNIKTALKRYKNRKTKENAEKVADAQLALINVLNERQFPKYVRQVLDMIFTRVVVDSFQKEFGDLKLVRTLHEMKLFLDKLYEDTNINPDVKKYSKERERSLIYGLGYSPSPVSVDLRKLKENPLEASSAVSTLVSMSLNYPVLSRNGNRFEIFNSGSENDNNCGFRAVAVGEGDGPNGYEEIQKNVIDGSKKILKELKKGSWPKTLDTDVLLENITDAPNITRGRLVRYLKRYISDRKNGFVGGMTYIELSLAAIGLGYPICVIDAEDGNEYTFLPNGKKIDGIIEYDGIKKLIYISIIHGHSTALLPLGKVDHDLTDNSMLEREVRNAVKNSTMSIILEEIKKLRRGKLQKSKCGYTDFYNYYTNKNKKNKNIENLFVTMYMICKILAKMSADEVDKIEKIYEEISGLANKAKNIKNAKAIKSKVEKCIKIISRKAVDICKDEPLFWLNFKTTIFA